MGDALVIGPRSLAVFTDETGSEDYGDPAFPVFGYGGCAAVGAEYNKVLAKPWKRLKRERLGGRTNRSKPLISRHQSPPPSRLVASMTL
jgi:hypothetical protein